MILSNRIRTLSESATIAMSRKSRELQLQGKDVINLSLGDPDFNTPDFIKEAAKKAIDEDYSHYPPVPGYTDLREVISKKFKRDNNLDFSPEQIVVSTGAKQSLANIMLALLNPGDEVLLPSPFWVTYKEIIKLAGGIPVIIETTVENDYKFTGEQIKKAISNKTKLLIFSSPCNPSGTVLSKKELKEIALAIEPYKNIFIISDEIYELINFKGKHESIAQFDFIKDRVIIVNGVSKAFAMTGWRIGYMAAPLEIANACIKIQGQFTSAPCSIAQRAALSALLTKPELLSYMKNSFKERRDLMLEKINEIPGLKTHIPEGAFFLFPDISYYLNKKVNGKTINTSNDLCMYLLNEAYVSLVPGEAFGSPNSLRISYASSKEHLIEAMKRIKKALEKIC